MFTSFQSRTDGKSMHITWKCNIFLKIIALLPGWEVYAFIGQSIDLWLQEFAYLAPLPLRSCIQPCNGHKTTHWVSVYIPEILVIQTDWLCQQESECPSWDCWHWPQTQGAPLHTLSLCPDGRSNSSSDIMPEIVDLQVDASYIYISRSFLHPPPVLTQLDIHALLPL